MTTKRIIFWIVMILLVSSLCQAVSISPVRRVVDFKPNGEYTLQLKLRNKFSKDLALVINVERELAEYIDIPKIVTMKSDEAEKTIDYSLTLPKELERPGVHRARITVSEHYSDVGRDAETMVAAAVSVVSEVWVRVAYPGKYAEAKLYIDSAEVNEDVNFAIGLMNFGEGDIRKAKAVIKILGSDYKEIDRVETNEISIKSKEDGKLTSKWLANVNAGKYHAVVEVMYDGKIINIEKEFEVGELYVAIKRIEVNDFSLGAVAIFNILLESKWNQKINNLYGEMTIFDSSGIEYTYFKTATTDIEPLGEAVLKAYWDTKEVKVGDYNLRLLIHYGERVTEKLIMTEVNIDSIRTELGPTARLVASKGLGKQTWLIVLVIVLLLSHIIRYGFSILKKKKARKRKK